MKMKLTPLLICSVFLSCTSNVTSTINGGINTTTGNIGDNRGTIQVDNLTLINYLKEGKYTGAKEVPEEEYKQLPEVITPSGANNLESFDLSDKMPTAGNQGYTQSSCVAWAVGYALKSFQEKIEENWDLKDSNHVFSPTYIFDNFRKSDSNCSNGLYIPDVLNFVKDNGIVSMKELPYDPNKCNRSDEASKFLSQAVKYKISAWGRVKNNNKEDIKTHLRNNSPVIISMQVFEELANLSKNNPILKNPQKATKTSHAVTLVGYDNKKNAFKFINSWGTDWGDNGYGWIDYSTFSKIVRECYVAVDSKNVNSIQNNLIINPKVAVEPNNGEKGAIYKQSGYGFTPNANISVYVKYPDGNKIKIFDKTTDYLGRFENSYNSSTASQFGQHEFSAVDNSTGKESPIFTFNIRLNLEPTPAPIIQPSNRNPIINSMSISPTNAEVSVGGTQTVTLNSSVSDVDGDNLSYQWYINNNPQRTGQNDSIDLGKGTHIIKLEVKNGKGGIATQEKTIFITEKQPVVTNTPNPTITQQPISEQINLSSFTSTKYVTSGLITQNNKFELNSWYGYGNDDGASDIIYSKQYAEYKISCNGNCTLKLKGALNKEGETNNSDIIITQNGNIIYNGITSFPPEILDIPYDPNVYVLRKNLNWGFFEQKINKTSNSETIRVYNLKGNGFIILDWLELN